MIFSAFLIRRSVGRGFASVVALACLTLLSQTLRAETLQEYPAAKREDLMRLITPIDQALALDAIPSASSDSGSILLSERLISVDEQGRRTIVRQVAYRAITDAGVKENSEEIVSYRKKEQKIYLITAETIQADGVRQPVKADAILLQSPQRQAEYSLYDDQAELKIIFPNVKPGSVTHLVVVIEDEIAKMPGEFSSSYTWGSEWASGLLRFRVDLPATMAARLKVESLGTGVPPPVVEKTAGDRVIHTWTTSKQPGRRYEIGSPPERQIGPVVNLSTIQSWEEVGRWYRSLLVGHDQLSDSLAKLADEWTAKAKDPAAIIAVLHSKVADQVRYVGLELGAADFQPHNCNEVWENQYGDCKDKANLLVALLRHKGIAASIALVNTDHMGLVDRRTPDFRVFTHAIVAVPQKNSGFLFCDPTIAYSVPGMIGPGSSDRDIFVVTEKNAEWVHTPAPGAGELGYQFELKLAASGELSGWLTFNADGYYGAGEHSHFGRLDPEDARSEMSKIVRGFFHGAEIVDVARVAAAAPAPFSIKAYFIVPAQARAAGDGNFTLKFPSSQSLYPDLGDRVERKTAFFMYKDKIRMKATLALPPGFSPTKIPAKFHFDSGEVSARAQWDFSSGVGRTELQIDTKQYSIKAGEFRPVYQAFQALQTWLAEPVVLSLGVTKTAAKATAPEIDMPMMPTGDGQIDLVEKRYPEDGNLEMRRLALERTLQYFPQDKETVFRAGVRLAVMDWNADRNQAAHDRLSALLASSAGQIKPEIYAWGEMMDGLALRDLKRTPEALALLERVTRNTTISDNRRSEAASNLADIMMKRSPAEALTMLQGIAALPAGATPGVELRIARLFLLTDQVDALRQQLTKIVATQPDTCEAQLTAMLEATHRWKLDGDERRMELLAEVIGAVMPKPGEALGQATQTCRLEAATRRIHHRLVEQLAAKPLSVWYAPDEAKKNTSLADYQKLIDEASKKEDPARCLRLILEALSFHGTEGDFPNRLWDAAGYAEWAERKIGKGIDPKVCDQLLDLCDQLPSGQAYFFEGKLLRAKRLAREGNVAAERAIYREMLASPDLTEQFTSPAAKRLGTNLVATGDFTGALSAYRLAEPVANSYRLGVNCLLQAALINLHLGDDNEAIRIIRLMEAIPENTLKESIGEAQVRELIALVQSGRAVECWNESRKWWPEWRRFADTVGIPADVQVQAVPEILNLTELGQALGQAKKSNDAKAYFRNFALLVGAARWQPSLAPELASVGPLTMQVVPDQSKEVRRLIIRVLAGPHPDKIDGLRSRQVWLAADYFDDQRAKEALRIVGEFDRGAQLNDNLARAMHRIRALAVLELGQDLAPTAAVLEADLVDPTASFQRASVVGLLADIYRRLGQNAAEETLLAREVENAAIVADADGHTELVARRGKIASSRLLAAGVETWVKSLALGWYDYAAPKGLDDPRLKDLEAVMSQPDRYFKNAEQIKLQLLAAQDVRRPVERRQQALREAVRLLLFTASDYRRVGQIAASVVDNAAFDEETRLQALNYALTIFSDDGRKDEYAVWRQNGLCGHFNDGFKKRLALLDLCVAVDRTSATAIAKLGETIAAQEITSFGISVMNDLFNHLLRIGDLAAATAFADTVPTWRLASEVGTGTEAVQFEYARLIRLAKSTNAVHEALASVVRAKILDKPAELPEEFKNLRIAREFPVLGREATLQASLYLIEKRQFNRSDFQFWAALLKSLPRLGHPDVIAGEMLRGALSAAPDDQLRAQIVSLFMSDLDLDEPTIRHSLDVEFAAYRRPVENPFTYAIIRFYELAVANRLGEQINPETAFADLTDARSKQAQQYFSLRVYTRLGDLPALKRTVDSFDAGTLLSSRLLSESIPVFELLGMSTELKLAKDVADRELRKELADSWAFHDRSAGIRTLSLARFVGTPTTLPAAWVSAVSSGAGDPAFQHHALLMQALLESNWVRVEAEAAVLNRDFPTHYNFYWYRGLSAFKLGKIPEAVEALKTFTRYAKDELDYKAALELLKQIEGPPVLKP